MDPIPCQDFVTDPPPIIPKRPTCTERTCIFNRHVMFVASMDLSTDNVAEVGESILAWTLWDIPATTASQIDDDRGEDLICLAVGNRIYWLDYQRYKDEWDWNAYSPIHQLIQIGPIPSNVEETAPYGYDLNKVKRFREFRFSLADGDVGAPAPYWDISVAEFNREAQTTRSTRKLTTQRMRARISTKGSEGFVVTLQHSAAEPVSINNWSAEWDVLGKRIRQPDGES